MNFSYSGLVVSLGLVALIGGCGGNSPSSDSPELEVAKKVTTELTVVDSYIMFATVFDANSTKIAITDEHGKVEITKKFTYPLYTAGGVFDVNGNAQVDEDDYLVPKGIQFSTNIGNVISPVTTFITLGADSEKLAQLLGVSEAELLGDAIEMNNTELAKAYQMLYAVMIFGASEHVIEAINTTNQKLVEASSDGLATLIVSTNLDNAELIDFVNSVSNIHFETQAKDIEEKISVGKAAISGADSPSEGYIPGPCNDIVYIDMSECSQAVSPSVFPAVSKRGVLPPIDGIDACYDYQHVECCTMFPELCSSYSSSSSMSSSSVPQDKPCFLPGEDCSASSSSAVVTPCVPGMGCGSTSNTGECPTGTYLNDFDQCIFYTASSSSSTHVCLSGTEWNGQYCESIRGSSSTSAYSSSSSGGETLPPCFPDGYCTSASSTGGCSSGTYFDDFGLCIAYTSSSAPSSSAPISSSSSPSQVIFCRPGEECSSSSTYDCPLGTEWNGQYCESIGGSSSTSSAAMSSTGYSSSPSGGETPPPSFN